MRVSSYWNTSAGVVSVPQILPGTFVLDWSPSFGVSNLNTDPASIAGKEIYSRVRAAYSGSLDADAPDYIMYLGALDSIFSYISYLKRIYRLLVAWSPSNYAIPDGVLHAMNFSSAEIMTLRRDRTKLWQYINELVYQSRKFTCPNTLDIMNRHYWLNDNLFTDADSLNAQFYLFNMVYAYKVEMLPAIDDPDITAPSLQSYPLPNCVFTSARSISVDSLYNFGLELIQALIDWDDAYTINGYLKRAYEGHPMFIVSELEQGEEIAPLYNEEVLTQIENAKSIPYGFEALKGSYVLANTVQQNISTNAVVTNPAINAKTGLIYGPDEIALSSRREMPNAGDVIIMSRMINFITTHTTQGTDNIYGISSGTEIMWCFRIVDPTSILDALTQPIGLIVPAYLDSASSVFTLNALQMGEMSAFDWHPLLQGRFGSPSRAYIFGDFHNLTYVDEDIMSNIHRVCLLSELNAFEI